MDARAHQTTVQRQLQRSQKPCAHHILQQETMGYKSPWQSMCHKMIFSSGIQEEVFTGQSESPCQ